jgi:alpha-beta hydrolase superfamily lysophospholipase
MAAWTDMAQRVEERAERSDRNGKAVSAWTAYLRAAAYWRASLMHYSFHEDPRVKGNASASQRCYERYVELSGYPATYVEIPYEDSFLPAYFYRSPLAPPTAPLLVFNQGRDAWPEDTRWVYDGAISRGIHCLAFHGPGQGLALRWNNLCFRYDWEKVISPVVDFALEIEGVDPARIGVMGLSFGGYLVPRAAAFEKRLRLCIANPGVVDWGGSIMKNWPPPVTAAFNAGPEAFNALVAEGIRQSPVQGWFIRDASWKHGAATPFDLFTAMNECNLESVAGEIACETLIMDGTGEVFQAGESQRLYDKLRCPKELMVFDETSTAQLHCQNGANATASAALFDWLDERL